MHSRRLRDVELDSTNELFVTPPKVYNSDRALTEGSPPGRYTQKQNYFLAPLLATSVLHIDLTITHRLLTHDI